MNDEGKDDALRKALAMLQSFNDNLPKSGIEEKYVTLYHKLLRDIGQSTDLDLGYFTVPDSDLQYRFYDGGRSENRYRDRAMMQIKLQGLINYLNSFLPDGPAKRIIGFTSPQ